MSTLTDEILKLIDKSTEEEQRIILEYLRERVPLHSLEVEWGTTAESILTAIDRSNDLTQRGIRGILAEAIFDQKIIPPLESAGWKQMTIAGDQSYDFMVGNGQFQIRIQVKLQRRERGEPKLFSRRARADLKCPAGTVYVVEVQKTRSGKRKGESTRPYRFGDFDILAVNLHASTGDWDRFLYTVGDWLLPRKAEAELIEIFQPVPKDADEYWTGDLACCIDWLLRSPKKRLYS